MTEGQLTGRVIDQGAIERGRLTGEALDRYSFERVCVCVSTNRRLYDGGPRV